MAAAGRAAPPAGCAAASFARRARRASTSAIGNSPDAMAAAIAAIVSSCVSREPIAITMSAPATSARTAAWPTP